MTDQPKVYVTRIIPDVGLDLIKANCNAEIWTEQLPPPYETIKEKIADCDGLVSLLTDRIDAELMDSAPKLKVIANYAVGFNNIDIPAATERGIAVGNTPGVLTDATADMAFCLLISAARRVVEGDKYSRDGKWKTWEPLGHLGQDLVNRTLGIVGMGRIGYAMAKRCRAWDMRILYHDKYRSDKAEADFGAKQVELEELLAESDFVSVHTDLNEDTKGLFNLARFKQMKKTAVFINSARGPIMVQSDLCEALKTGEIFAAGLDVTDPEPPSVDDPLLTLPNVVVAPHIASATVGTRNAMAEICANNLLAGVSGEELTAFVNPEVQSNRRK